MNDPITTPTRVLISGASIAGPALAFWRHRYGFEDSITSLTETADGVDVTFAHADPAGFDLVVGADGIHSNVRALAFGPEGDYVTRLGHSYVLARLDAGDDDVMYNEPGRMAALGGSKAPAFFVFASEPHEATREDVDAQKRQVAAAYAHGGWRLHELMQQIPAAREFHMDSISRVTMDRYTKGRVALVGDSAYGNALGGFGTGLAIVGAYVLAGELHRAAGDHTAAFRRYEDVFRGYASVSQKVNAGRLLAPATRFGIRARNLMFSALSLASPLMRLVDRPATNIRLEDYSRPAEQTSTSEGPVRIPDGAFDRAVARQPKSSSSRAAGSSCRTRR